MGLYSTSDMIPTCVLGMICEYIVSTVRVYGYVLDRAAFIPVIFMWVYSDRVYSECVFISICFVLVLYRLCSRCRLLMIIAIRICLFYLFFAYFS